MPSIKCSTAHDFSKLLCCFRSTLCRQVCNAQPNPTQDEFVTCPNCGSFDVRRSRSSHWTDAFRSTRERVPYRCRSCRKRFFSMSELEKDGDHPNFSWRTARQLKRERAARRRQLRRTIAIIMVLLVAFVIFLLFLRRITNGAPGQRVSIAHLAASRKHQPLHRA